MKKLFTLLLFLIIFTFTGCNFEEQTSIADKSDEQISSDKEALSNSEDTTVHVSRFDFLLDSEDAKTNNTEESKEDKESTDILDDELVSINRALVTTDGILKLEPYSEFIDTCEHYHVIGNLLCIDDKKYLINNTSPYWDCLDRYETYNTFCEFIKYDASSQRILLDCGIKLLIFDITSETFEVISSEVLDYKVSIQDNSITYCDLSHNEYSCNWTTSANSVKTENSNVYHCSNFHGNDILKFGGRNDMPDEYYWDTKSKTLYDESNKIILTNVVNCTTDWDDVLYVLTADGTLYARPLSSTLPCYQYYGDWDTLYEKNKGGFYLLANNVLGIYENFSKTVFIVERHNAELFFNGYPIIRFN